LECWRRRKNIARLNMAVTDLLHERVMDWAAAEGWTSLRPFQERALEAIVTTAHDVLICAPTAAGKTEAALLPVLSLVLNRTRCGARVLYVVPLKALANDLDRRIETLGRATDLPIHRWHGDVPQMKKKAFVEAPSGVLLITPESLEAVMMNYGHESSRIFGGLEAVVVDEVHSYVGTERGAHLRSLLHRIEQAVGRSVRRIGLSATVGEPSVVSVFLRDQKNAERTTIVTGEAIREVSVRISTFTTGKEAETAHRILGFTNENAIVFVNSRAGVEWWTDLLTEASGSGRKIHAHHGNLSRTHREGVEKQLRAATEATTVLATGTLELGIDLGSIDHITQIGVPPTVSSLHQRAGRGGRRQRQSKTDVILHSAPPDHEPADPLYLSVIQSIASVELQREGWSEQPSPHALHLSTLVQQILSMIVQHGGVLSQDLSSSLCAGAAFATVDWRILETVIEDLVLHRVLRRSTETGLLRLDDEGEKLVCHYKFYAAFWTPPEFRVVGPEGLLGSIQPTRDMGRGDLLLFAGRRWIITRFSPMKWTVEVAPAPAGTPPRFCGAAIPVATKVRQRMLNIFLRGDAPTFADAATITRLAAAREAFRAASLHRTRILLQPQRVEIFPWTGTDVLLGLELLLRAKGLDVAASGVALEIEDVDPADVGRALSSIAIAPPDTAAVLKLLSEIADFEKHHRFLRRELVAADYMSQRVDLESARAVAADLVATWPDSESQAAG
jgi:ATP-dependent Lhr-like helicase